MGLLLFQLFNLIIQSTDIFYRIDKGNAIRYFERLCYLADVAPDESVTIETLVEISN